MSDQCPTCGSALPEASGECPVCGSTVAPGTTTPDAAGIAPGTTPVPQVPPTVIPPPAPPMPPSQMPPVPPAGPYPPPPGGYVPPGGSGGPQSPAGWTVPPSGPAKPIEQILAEGYHIDLGAAIGEGWNIFAANVGGFVGFALLGGVIAILMGITVIGLLFVTPLMAGFFIVPLLMLKGRSTTFGNFFDGFNRLGPYLLLGLVMGIFIFFGYIFLIIPGIYLTVAYTWALALMADRGMGYWEAMKTSMRVVNRNFWETLLLALIVSIISSAGGVVVLGYIVTMPLSYCILIAAYRRIFGLSGN